MVPLALSLAGWLEAQEPLFDQKGFEPTRQTVSQLAFEHIDPLTGNVLLTFTDLHLPGNAGFVLRIQRTYNSKVYKQLGTQIAIPGEDSWAGLGWTFHMGRLIFPNGAPPAGYCSTCPIAIEMPDGKRTSLFPHIDGIVTHMTTKEFWTYEHDVAGSPVKRILRLPSGVRYVFNGTTTHQLESDASLRAQYVDTIEDPFGNAIKVTYRAGLPHLMHTVEQHLKGSPPQVRTISFDYDSTLGSPPVGSNSLKAMRYNPGAGRPEIVWTYQQGTRAGLGVGYTVLENVLPPEGPSWAFSYYANGAIAPFALSRVVTPGGGQIDYIYERHAFVLGSSVITSPALIERTVSASPPTAGDTWNYSYQYDTTPPKANLTVVTPPGCNGPSNPVVTVFRFLDLSEAQDEVYRLGSLHSRTLQNPAGTVKWEEEKLTWAASAKISPTNEGQIGDGTRVPLLQNRELKRGSATYTTTHTYNNASPYHVFSASRASNFGDYGRPWRTVEAGELSRTTERTFFYPTPSIYPGFSNYIVDKTDTERLNPATPDENFLTDYDHDSDGFLKKATVRKLETTFERDTSGSGNRRSATDGRGKQTSFTYTWGMVRTIALPHSTTTRTIFPEGLVASEERRGFTTTFDYDRLLRLRRRTPAANLTPPSYPTAVPGSFPTFTEYSPDARWVKTIRAASVAGSGASFLQQTFDGLGRPTGTEDAVGIKTRLAYDSCGRRNYESYPFVGSADKGTLFTLDPLDRAVQAQNPGVNSVKTFEYAGSPANGIDVLITDEEGRKTRQDWSAYGDPRDARLMAVTSAEGSPDANVTSVTSYAYNGLGALKSVDTNAPGADRSWSYYDSASEWPGLLASETHPESGTVSYTYDEAGNLLERTDQAFGTTRYTYDGNNRLTNIDRFSGQVGPLASAFDTSMTYDASDNRTRLVTNNGSTASDFVYDGANRLLRRTDRTAGRTFPPTTYTPTQKDQVARIDYPSGTRVDYSYDDQNRITAVSNGAGLNFAHSFTYHASGGIAQYRSGNGPAPGVLHTISYDADRYWITGISDTAGGLALTYGLYDKVGNVGQITDARAGMGPLNLQYDDLDRLTGVGGAAWATSTYEYDQRGNRTRKQVPGGSAVDYFYSAATQRLTGYTGSPNSIGYDLAGNTTSDPLGTYTYTPSSLLRTSTQNGVTTEYAYDGDGLRKLKNSGPNRRYFVHGAGGQLLGEQEQTGSNAPTPVRDYIYAGTRLIAAVKPPALVATPASLAFAAILNGPLTAGQDVSVSTGTSMNWSAYATKDWVVLTPANGGPTLPATLNVKANPTGLPIGTHTASVWISAVNAFGGPKEVAVSLIITGTPGLAARPPNLTFDTVEGGFNPTDQMIHVVYSGGTPVSWTASATSTPAGWLAISPGSGTTSSTPGVSASVNAAGLAAGTYTGEIRILSPGTEGSPQIVPVQLVVQPPAGGTCASGAWYCEAFDGLQQGDLGGQGGWAIPPPNALHPHVVGDPRGQGHVMQLDPAPTGQANSIRNVSLQSIDSGFELSMQVMSSGVPAGNRQIAKLEFFTANAVAWGKTKRTFGAIRFGSALYLQYGPNVYQVLEPVMEQDRWYRVNVEYYLGRIDAYVDGQLRFSASNPLTTGQSMQAFAVTGWDFQGSAHLDLLQGRPLTSGMVVEPRTLALRAAAGGPPPCPSCFDDPSTRGRGTQQVQPPPASPLARLKGGLPLQFEANQGQTDEEVKFFAKDGAHALILTGRDVRFALGRSGLADRKVPHADLVRMSFVGGNSSPVVLGRKKLPGVSNYLLGQDPSRWRIGVPHYAEVVYREMYPGIDLVFHGRGQKLEYDLLVAPEADADAIRLAFEGVDDMAVDAQGDLVLKTAAGELRQSKPMVYQEVEGERRLVDGRYELDEMGQVRFRLARYDHSEALVIDPVLIYSTYLGGDTDGFDPPEAAQDVGIDEDQYIYLTGQTTAIDFPTTAAYQPMGGAPGASAFVTKFAPDGSHLIYSTYIGGVASDTRGHGIAVDPGGTAFVTGQTTAPDFPLVSPWLTSLGGPVDGFLLKLDPTGAPLFSTYIGGPGTELAFDVALNSSGSAPGVFVVGVTAESSTFGDTTPIAVNPGVPIGQPGNSDVFVVKFPATGVPTQPDSLVFLNGASVDNGRAIAVDASNNVYVGGDTTSLANTTQGPFPASSGAYQSPPDPFNYQAFLTKLDMSGAPSLRYSALIGGNSVDMVTSVAIPAGCLASCTAYVAGMAQSSDFPLVSSSLGTGWSFVSAVSPIGSTLLRSARFGGDFTAARDIAVDSGANVHVVGPGGTFPTGGACRTNAAFGESAPSNGRTYLNRINADWQGFGYCVLLKGRNPIGDSLAVDSAGTAYVVGSEQSGPAFPPAAFPITPNAYDASLGGVRDAFLAIIGNPSEAIQFSSSTNSVAETQGSVTILVTRSGEPVSGATVDYATSNGTAAAPSDYQAVAGTLTFAPGQTTRSFVVPIVDDELSEEPESVNLTLSNSSVSLGYPETSTLTIHDDDASCATFTVRDRVLATGPAWTATKGGPFSGLISLSASSGTGPSTVTVCGQPILGPGVFTATITVTNVAGGDPQVIDVTFNVTGTGGGGPVGD
jgi:YD repeat-containing protein